MNEDDDFALDCDYCERSWERCQCHNCPECGEYWEYCECFHDLSAT